MSTEDAEGRTPERAIKMHEFLMTGGVKVGEREGRVVYSDPIDWHDQKWATACPWHGVDPDAPDTPACKAWSEIVAGRGYWTAMEDELDRLMAEAKADDKADPERGKRTEELAEKLAMRPRDAKALRERTPAMIAEEKARVAQSRRDFGLAAKAAQAAAESLRQGKAPSALGDAPEPRVYAKAGSKTGGNPWDRDTSASRLTSTAASQFTGNPAVNTNTGEVSDDWERNELADGVAAAFAGEDVPDEIIIEGNEEDED